MSKHTPGPWTALHQHRISIIQGPSGEHIADTGAWRDDEYPEMRANARLIAAAPELLEACVDVEGKIESYANGEINWRPDDFLQRVRAAIAKTKGRGDET